MISPHALVTHGDARRTGPSSQDAGLSLGDGTYAMRGRESSVVSAKVNAKLVGSARAIRKKTPMQPSRLPDSAVRTLIWPFRYRPDKRVNRHRSRSKEKWRETAACAWKSSKRNRPPF